jgi:hypothetical protein
MQLFSLEFSNANASLSIDGDVYTSTSTQFATFFPTVIPNMQVSLEALEAIATFASCRCARHIFRH